MTSIFKKYGGIEPLKAIVKIFYQRILLKPEIQKYFVGIDMDRLMDHQANYLAVILGAETAYTGADVKQIHQRLKVKKDDFNFVATTLLQILKEKGFTEEELKLVEKHAMMLGSFIIESDESEKKDS